MKRNRMIYGLLTGGVVLLGLASRLIFGHIPFVKLYVGDALWALMVFFGFGFVARRWSTRAVTLVALLFAFSIEISQLYHAPWIDSLRATRLGGLILGFSFVWSDFICYGVGVAVGAVIETYLLPEHFRNSSKAVIQMNRVTE